MCVLVQVDMVTRGGAWNVAGELIAAHTAMHLLFQVDDLLLHIYRLRPHMHIHVRTYTSNVLM